MMDTVITWMFWIGAGVIAYSAVAASIRYFHFWRRGARTMAAEADLQHARRPYVRQRLGDLRLNKNGDDGG